MTKRVGLLTGGGDCPGLNAVIRAVTRRLLPMGYQIVGFRNGWKGVLDREVEPLTREKVAGTLHLGGTILGTSRTNPFRQEDGSERCLETIRGLGLEAVVAIGGEDTLGVAQRLWDESRAPIVGVPKTIDNDLSGTDQTFGFDTAVQVATEAIDRLHSTAESHQRVMVVEVMGRDAGWIALYSSLAGGADFLIIPEFPVTLDDVCACIRERFLHGRRFSIVVVSEGARFTTNGGDEQITQHDAVDEFGHVTLGGVSHVVAHAIRHHTGFDTRVTILGHIQRGGTPTAFDRVLATRYGVHAAEMVLRREYGHMASLRGTQITSVALEEAVIRTRLVTADLYQMARTFFG